MKKTKKLSNASHPPRKKDPFFLSPKYKFAFGLREFYTHTSAYTDKIQNTVDSVLKVPLFLTTKELNPTTQNNSL